MKVIIRHWLPQINLGQHKSSSFGKSLFIENFKTCVQYFSRNLDQAILWNKLQNIPVVKDF